MLSLKARALELLAQREQSRVELRRKLLRLARAGEASKRRDDSAVAESAEAVEDDSAVPVRVDALLDWLEAHRYLSSERFVESRVHARASRFGNLRIRQELKEHGLSVPADAAERLKASELDRARDVCARKFAAPAETAADQAKRMRFLIGRGFSPEVVRRVMREPRRGDD